MFFLVLKVLKALIHLNLKKGLKCGGEQNVKTIFLLFDSVKIFLCCLHPYNGQNNKIFIQTFRCAAALWKSWVCKYSIRFQIRKLKLLCKILKNEKWKILAWYPKKMRRYCQGNSKCGDWGCTNFQMQVALN